MKICLWGDIASALNGKTGGGGELQMALLAKALVKSGHEIVVLDVLTNFDFITSDGVKVFQVKGWNNGIKFFRFFTHQMPKLYLALKAQKADIYYCQIRGFAHILALWAARKSKGKFVLQLASDLDALGFYQRLKHDYLTHFEGTFWFLRIFLTELIFPRLVRNADLLLVQHEGQRNILLQKGIKSTIFNNLLELNEVPDYTNIEKDDFCYVGSLDKRKGFVDFFELVKRSPSHSFKVIGQPRDKKGYLYFEKLKSFNNVKLLGRLSHSETMFHIAKSKALISTSPMEGFPNVFIEAWACGIPVLSLYFDPGGILTKEKLGFISHGDLEKLSNALESELNTIEFAERSKTYVDANHVLNANKIEQIDLLFRGVVKNQN